MKAHLCSRYFSLLNVFFLLGYLLNTGIMFGQSVNSIDLSKHWVKQESFALSGVATTISYIPLETKKECYIPNAYECSFQATEAHFFVTPRSKPMMIFDRKGKYIGKVGSIGEGPGELVTIGSYVINEKGGWIAFFKPANSSVLVYNFNGKQIREFYVDKSITRLMSDPDGNMVGLSIDIQNKTIGDSRLIFLDTHGVELQRIELYKTDNVKNRIQASGSLNVIWGKNGIIQVFERPYDKIYERGERGNWRIFPGFISGENATIQSVRLIRDLYLIIATNPNINYFVAVKSTGEVTNCSFLVEAKGPDLCGFYNDLDGGLPFWPTSLTSETEMDALFDAPMLIDCATGSIETYGGKAPQVQQSFKEMTTKLTLEDNPVVVVVKLK